MISILLNNKHYEMPRAWNELRKNQLIACLSIIENNWPDDRKRLALLRLLTGISWWRFMFCKMNEVAEYFYLLEFLFEDNTLTKNLLPYYRGRYGPANNFENLIASEYVFTEAHYLLYKEHEEQTDIDSLVGILYRSGKNKLLYNYRLNPAGDKRQPFNDNLIPIYAARVKHWPASIKRAILHYYEGCRQQIVISYGDCFGGSGEPAKRGMLSLVVMMADTGIFGSFEKCEKLLLHTFFIGLSENIDQAKRNTPKPAA